ncbi:MAG: hypothetical protein EXS50_03660 [Candidatus Taylorbacteria bacterium]|nr:hypothetical protein [Candidatus Taylorbacteria bacterium]
MKPKLLVFASGEKDPKDGGGSGFKKLVEATLDGSLEAEIVAVVSNNPAGGVFEKARELKIPFVYFPLPREAADYQRIVRDTGAQFVALSGWMRLAKGLDPKTTFNIHPGPLPRFGGAGMWGHFVHEAVLEAFSKGEIDHTEVSMHFVTDPKSKDDYDKGPVFYRASVSLFKGDTAITIAKRTNEIEHKIQPLITNLVVSGQISWDGINPESLIVPSLV